MLYLNNVMHNGDMKLIGGHSEQKGDREGTRENVGECGCEIETATAPTTVRSSSPLP